MGRRLGKWAMILVTAHCAGCGSTTSHLEMAFEQGRGALLLAVDRTDAAPGEQRRATCALLRATVLEAPGAAAFARAVEDRFRLRPVRAGGRAEMHFTAYYAPEYEARRAPTGRFRHPLYGPDAEVIARRSTRREIIEGDLLAGREIAWLGNALDAYLVQVNGSARLRLPGGQVMHVGHAATNERPYTSLGRLLIEEGIVDEASMSMAAIRAAFDRDPRALEALMLRNDRYVFFEEIDAEAWPRGSTGMVLTPGASCATDPDVIAPGSVLLVETTMPDGTPYARLVIAQDTGGAIRGGRIDLYLGAGEAVGAVAGALNAPGRAWVVELMN